MAAERDRMGERGGSSNQEQIDYWNGDAGARWVKAREEIDALLAPLTAVAIERAGVAPGSRVVDIGCGCGTTTLALGRLTGPAGTVLGIDVSAAMIEHARSRVPIEVTHIAFSLADASTHRFEPQAAHVAFSRFGVMFFADPVRALANIRTALRPRGSLVFVCWQALVENEWARIPLEAALSCLPPPEPPVPTAPGPFAFADAARVRRILEGAAYAHVAIEALRLPLRLTGSVDAAVAFYRDIGPAARLLREAAAEPRARALEAMREALVRCHDGDGIRMGSAAWLVCATA
jgi:SAM-dependent methyltransferase